jgi:hypothetical protein
MEMQQNREVQSMQATFSEMRLNPGRIEAISSSTAAFKGQMA